MTHHTDAERPWWRDRADEIELQVAQGKMSATACYTQMVQLLDADRRAPAAPVPLRKPTVAQVTDAIGYHASAWDCVGPRELIDAILMLAAAPQPPEAAQSNSAEFDGIETKAAHAELPEPVAYQWLSTDNFRISGGPVSGAYWNKLYTEQQVRDLLAAHGIGKDKA